MKKKETLTPKQTLWLIIFSGIFIIVITILGQSSSSSYSYSVADRNQRALDALQSASDAKDAKCRAHPEWC
ncbi:MAG: hypothetical protein KA155_01540 [Alphaproteobacteria bacterium]|jgi:hypothetical protein|nr:hypothetical protein [Alphaproteobacteria bacterium]